jgi:hypothetical protein
MGTLPSANTTVQDTATAKAAGQDLICVLAPVPTAADITPRQFGSASAIYAQHGYSEGVEYAALHVEQTGLPVLFVGLPISTTGVVGRIDDTGNTDTCVVSVAVGGSGCLAEHDGVCKVVVGGTIGTDQIQLDVSGDGGRTFKRVRLGTASSYVVPFLGVTLSFAAGDLTAGETVLTWHGTAPRVASADVATARDTLASMLKFFRSVLLVGDLQNSTEALAYNTELDGYASENDRFIFGRASVLDRLPLPVNSTTGGDLVFDETADTITRTTGSWISDGFKVGQTITVAGTDGGTNDGDFVLVAVSALELELEAGDVVGAETSPSTQVSVTAAQTKAAWMAEIDAAFAAVDAKMRIDMSAGRARILSPFTGYQYRRPAAWAASLREYQHDLHIPTWRKSDGPVLGDLFDTDGALVEWDDRVDGGAACAARFTSFRTWSNGPAGAFIAQSFTRASDDSLLSRTHNVAVTNVACTTVQLNAELAIGESLILNADGTATEDSLSTIEDRINNALRSDLLENKKGEGPRASFAKYTASREDLFNVPEPILNGVTKLKVRGTIHTVNTPVKVLSGGQ